MKNRQLSNFIGACVVLLAGCSSSLGDGTPNPEVECSLDTNPPLSSSGFALKAFCSPHDPGKKSVWFAASGEALALTGYAFPPAQADDAVFVDGWQVQFRRLLVTLDKITLSENPDYDKGDQSQNGKLVAQVDGPWAVDLSRSDVRNLPGKGSPEEQAVPIAALKSQNRNGGGALASDGTRYAFGFDIVTAQAQAQNVNLDAEALSDYEEMIQQGCSIFYIGTATFKGDAKVAGCLPEPQLSWPKTVNFRLCFKSPASYLNCQNPDNDPARPFDGEEHQRGLAISENSSVMGQLTLHSDHPFWDSVLHGSPAHFDQYAARAVGKGQTPTVTLTDMLGVDYTAVRDANGQNVPWRYCVTPPSDVHPPFQGVMRFDAQTVPHASGADPALGLRDYADFATYNQSTQGHLNADGLCFVRRNYASPD